MSGLASDNVHAKLRGEILDGSLPAGAAVPSERTLAEELGVNRHAVREALKRLQQADLVRISQGGATRVLDWRESAGLEVLLDLTAAPSEPPAELMRSVLEMRESVGVDAAGKFCERAGADLRERAATLAGEAAAGGATGLASFVELWRVVVAGSGNLAYRLALNSLNGALDAYPELASSLRSPADAEGLREFGEALAAADEEAARGAARRLLAADVAALA